MREFTSASNSSGSRRRASALREACSSSANSSISGRSTARNGWARASPKNRPRANFASSCVPRVRAADVPAASRTGCTSTSGFGDNGQLPVRTRHIEMVHHVAQIVAIELHPRPRAHAHFESQAALRPSERGCMRSSIMLSLHRRRIAELRQMPDRIEH